MDDTNEVTITGVLAERPSYSETGNGVTTATFHVQTTRTWKATSGDSGVHVADVPCFAVGHAANALRVYSRAGLAIVVTGHLDVRNYPCEQGGSASEMILIADTVGFVSPRQACEQRQEQVTA